MAARPDDGADSRASSAGDADEGLTEGFGGEATSVVPDTAASSRWDRNAQDEDALVADE
ncbi:hypothetical protein FHX52_1456 [Humibacillus xanthopallidus]|uniref:Uncharacterized protein n=2 Tax=Humibacillus xanthopallidus TaxID=412689 RepID=A0A543PWA1_9MICO|nr:hypothetical protein FHX52_1456 [Humibacillus xanthopallidus]